MRRSSRLLIVPAVAIVAIGIAGSADHDPVPLFTGEDLDRMFGPAPPQPSDLVDETRPEDWRWIEQFIDRQYSRIDADRQYELQGRVVDIAETRVAPWSSYYGGALAWGLRYPASTWWNSVAGHYAWATGHADHQRGREDRPRGEHGRGQAHGQGQGHGHSPRHK